MDNENDEIGAAPLFVARRAINIGEEEALLNEQVLVSPDSSEFWCLLVNACAKQLVAHIGKRQPGYDDETSKPDCNQQQPCNVGHSDAPYLHEDVCEARRNAKIGNL